MAESTQGPVFVLSGSTTSGGSALLILSPEPVAVAPIEDSQRHTRLYVGSGYCDVLGTQVAASLRHTTFAFLARSLEEARGTILAYMESTYPRTTHFNYRVDISVVPDTLTVEAVRAMGYLMQLQLANPDELPPMPVPPVFPTGLDWNGDGKIDASDVQMRTNWLPAAMRGDLQGTSQLFQNEFFKYSRAMYRYQLERQAWSNLKVAMRV